MSVATVPRAGDAAPSLRAGRMCPFDYRYRPSVFRREPELDADIVYVIGGLYGNLPALDAIERLAQAERAPVTLVFNGDFHWFDAAAAWFSGIERRVSAYPALRGNVETEIARAGDIGAGCGCAYPESVGDGVVQRSNDILRDLRGVAAALPGARERLARLPMHLVARVGRSRVGIVHGDAASLAGWRFAYEALDDPRQSRNLKELRSVSNVDIFASTHTCLAALRQFRTPSGPITIVNNGSAGMPNFRDTRFGVLSRIATRPAPHPALYGVVQGDIHIDALAVPYDHRAFLAQFVGRWRDNSPAHVSYFHRIMNGPDHTIDRARA